MKVGWGRVWKEEGSTVGDGRVPGGVAVTGEGRVAGGFQAGAESGDGAVGVVTDQGPRGTQRGLGSPKRRCHGRHSRPGTPAGCSQGPPSRARRRTRQGEEHLQAQDGQGSGDWTARGSAPVPIPPRSPHLLSLSLSTLLCPCVLSDAKSLWLPPPLPICFLVRLYRPFLQTPPRPPARAPRSGHTDLA